MRETYINFFKERGHAQISSAPLIPENDPTVLFTTAGMHPLVPYLLGEKHPAGRRLTDFQKCVRTGDQNIYHVIQILKCLYILLKYFLNSLFLQYPYDLLAHLKIVN